MKLSNILITNKDVFLVEFINKIVDKDFTSYEELEKMFSSFDYKLKLSPKYDLRCFEDEYEIYNKERCLGSFNLIEDDTNPPFRIIDINLIENNEPLAELLNTIKDEKIFSVRDIDRKFHKYDYNLTWTWGKDDWVVFTVEDAKHNKLATFRLIDYKIKSYYDIEVEIVKWLFRIASAGKDANRAFYLNNMCEQITESYSPFLAETYLEYFKMAVEKYGIDYYKFSSYIEGKERMYGHCRGSRYTHYYAEMLPA